MAYMNKEITFIENKENNFTYITPHNIITTRKQVTKEIDHKLK